MGSRCLGAAVCLCVPVCGCVLEHGLLAACACIRALVCAGTRVAMLSGVLCALGVCCLWQACVSCGGVPLCYALSVSVSVVAACWLQLYWLSLAFPSPCCCALSVFFGDVCASRGINISCRRPVEPCSPVHTRGVEVSQQCPVSASCGGTGVVWKAGGGP